MREIIHVFKEENKWCAIYPMGSTVDNCDFIAFSPENIKFNKYIGRERDYGKNAVIQKIKDENKDLPTHSFYCEYWD